MFNSWLFGLSETEKEQIIGIYLIPTIFINTKQTMLEGEFNKNQYQINLNKNLGWLQNINNNKLYTYPYNVLHVIGSDGNSADFKYELFKDIPSTGGAGTFTFWMICSIGLPPEFILIPIDYAIEQITIGSGLDAYTTTNENYNEALTLKNIPMSAWNTDGFKAWLAQTTTGLIGSGMGFAAMAGLGNLNPAFTGIKAFSKMSFAASAYSSIAGIPKAQLLPNYAHGEQKNNPFMQCGRFGFTFYNAHVKPEYAAIIDDYFTKYGYATKRVKKPNLNSRPYWNYIETKNCNIDQSYNNVVKGLNIEDTRKLSDIYDHGITFWHPDVRGTLVTVDVGDYSKDNSPLLG